MILSTHACRCRNTTPQRTIVFRWRTSEDPDPAVDETGQSRDKPVVTLGWDHGDETKTIEHQADKS
jgi:hypothetical protein